MNKKILVLALFMISLAYISAMPTPSLQDNSKIARTILTQESDYNGDGIPDVSTTFTQLNDTTIEILAHQTNNDGKGGNAYKWSSAICNLSGINSLRYLPEDAQGGFNNSYPISLNYGKLANYGMPSSWCNETGNNGFVLFGGGSGDKRYRLLLPSGQKKFKIFTGKGSEEVLYEWLNSTLYIYPTDTIDFNGFTIEVLFDGVKQTYPNSKWVTENSPINLNVEFNLNISNFTQRNNITFRQNRLDSFECTKLGELTSCTRVVVNYSEFERLNTITNKTTTPIYHTALECLSFANILDWEEFLKCRDNPYAYDVYYIGNITNLDPSLTPVYLTADNLINKTYVEASTLGARLTLNSSGQYNATLGNFLSFGYYNSTAYHWLVGLNNTIRNNNTAIITNPKANITIQFRQGNSYNTSDANLVALWGFNGNALDEKGILNGTFGGTAGAYNNGNGSVGQGYWFAGTAVDGTEGSFMTFANTGLPTGNSARTITAWINSQRAGYNDPIIKYGTSSAYQGWSCDLNVNQLRVCMYAECSGASTSTLATNTWYHVAFVYHGNKTVDYYVNGKKDGSATFTNTPNTGTTYAMIGGLADGVSWGGTSDFRGAIDEVKIYSDALTASEIQNLYELGEYHINWNGTFGSENNAPAQSSINTSGSSKFMQFKINMRTNDSVSSPYLYGTNVTAYTPPDTQFPQVIFSSQTPADLNITNFIGVAGVNITYNATDNIAISQANSYLYYKSNDSVSNVQFYQNGTAYSGYFGTNASTVSAPSYTWNLKDNNVLQGTYNFGEVTMENTAHTAQLLTNANSMVSIELLNVSNSTQYSFFEVMANTTGNPATSPAILYYCNNSFAFTNSPASNPNCAVMKTIINSTYDHTHTIYSSHLLIPFGINTTAGTTEGIKITSNSYFILKGSNSANWYFYTISGTARANAFRTTTNNGVTWTPQNAYVVDAHMHQFPVNSTLWYYACFNDTSNNQNCTTPRSDRLEYGGLAPSAPFVYSPNSTYNFSTTATMPIKYTESVSPNGYSIDVYNITLYNSDYSFNQTIVQNNVPNLIYNWAIPDELQGQYIIGVKACDSNGLCSEGFSEPFYIVSPAPVVDILTPSNTTYTSNINALITDVTSVDTLDECWYSQDGGINNETVNCIDVINTVPYSTEGSNTWSYCAETIYGTQTCQSVTFYVDLPCTNNIVAPANLSTQYTVFMVSLTATDTQGVSKQWFVIDDDGNITYTAPYSYYAVAGTHNITAYCNDTYGSITSKKHSFTVINEQDPSWTANWTNMQGNCPTGTFMTGFYGNGSKICSAEADPIFLAENSSLWLEARNKFNASYDALIAFGYNHTSEAINWVMARYYNTTQINTMNASIWNYIHANESSWVSTFNETYSLYAYNHTSSVFTLWGQWFYNQTTGALDWVLNQGYINSTNTNPLLILPIEKEYNKNESILIQSICKYTNGTLCGDSVKCFFNSHYPNQSLIVFNGTMNYSGQGTFNYSLGFTSNNTNLLGSYPSLVECYDNLYRNEAPFTFVVSLTDAKPNINITYPSNWAVLAFPQQINVSVLFTSSDDNGISAYWYSLNGGTNITFSNNLYLSLQQQDGTHKDYTLTIYVNDTINQIASDSITFTVYQTANPGGSKTPYYDEIEPELNVTITKKEQPPQCSVNSLTEAKNCLNNLADNIWFADHPTNFLIACLVVGIIVTLIFIGVNKRRKKKNDKPK